MDADLSYYSAINPLIYDRIPLGAKRVVEVGCAAGVLGKNHKLRSPECEYIGIEIDEQVAKYAKYELDRVIVGDAEDSSVIDRIERGSADCIIYGDVLEHLRDPWGALSWHRSWLKDDGIVLICLPNVGHISVLAQLLEGNWSYRDRGLLDRTHIRFFTYNEIVRMVLRAGYQIDDSIRKRQRVEQYAEFEEELAELVRKHGLNANLKAQTETYQYVISASKRLTPFSSS